MNARSYLEIWINATQLFEKCHSGLKSPLQNNGNKTNNC